MKCTDEVAAFFFANKDGAGYWRVKLKAGVIVDCAKFTLA